MARPTPMTTGSQERRVWMSVGAWRISAYVGSGSGAYLRCRRRMDRATMIAVVARPNPASVDFADARSDGNRCANRTAAPDAGALLPYSSCRFIAMMPVRITLTGDTGRRGNALDLRVAFAVETSWTRVAAWAVVFIVSRVVPWGLAARGLITNLLIV